MNLERAIYENIMSSIGSVLPETGGILGSRDGDICAYYFDSSGSCDSNTYRPDTVAVNKAISDWAKQGIQFVGVIHSHEERKSKLSCADVVYARSIMDSNDMKEILFPLVLTGSNTRLIMYKVDRCGGITEEKITLI